MEDIGLEIKTEKEQFWNRLYNKLVEEHKQLEKELMLNEKMQKMAVKEEAKEKKKGNAHKS